MIEKTDRNGFTILFAGIVMVISFSVGLLVGGWTVWKNFKKDQDWIRKEIVQLEDEREKVDDLIQTLRNLMDEIGEIERW